MADSRPSQSNAGRLVLLDAITEAERLLSGALEPGAMGRPVRCFTRGEMADIEMALAALQRIVGES